VSWLRNKEQPSTLHSDLACCAGLVGKGLGDGGDHVTTCHSICHVFSCLTIASTIQLADQSVIDKYEKKVQELTDEVRPSPGNINHDGGLDHGSY